MYAVLSDIHGNMYALEQVIRDMSDFDIEGIILLGDLIDYGMQSNEVVDFIRTQLNEKIICSIWGNHERAILSNDYSGFSSERGTECARYTASRLSSETVRYLNDCMIHDGMHKFMLKGKKILSVHGSLNNVYWKAVSPDDVKGDYSKFDIVLSGHSHLPHMFYKFYAADDPERRNRHAVLFINPGSAGQPRNHNPLAQYALLDAETLNVQMRAVHYDTGSAMSLYDGSVDEFYRTRLKTGV